MENTPAKVEKPVPKKMSLSDILDIIDEVILPSELDIIISRAGAVKKQRTQDTLAAGDIVRLSDNSSPLLQSKYQGKDIVILSVDREGMHHVELDGTAGTFTRDKLLFIRHG